MQSVSTAWETAQNELLAPEGFVEISYSLTPDIDVTGITVTASADQLDEDLSDLTDVLGNGAYPAKVATLERNLWSLDGSCQILDSRAGMKNADGYVSENFDSGEITVGHWSEIQFETLPGVTIIFSETYGEWAEEFTVNVHNGDEIYESVTITGNTQNRVVVDLGVSNYDAVSVVVTKWSIPYHRARIDQFLLGLHPVYTKEDILSFTHEQVGSLISGELPKNSVSFSLDNSEGRWDPNSSTSYAQYLSERQPIQVRYGFDLNGTVEWGAGGIFYLSEWKIPSNGLEAQFVARDALEFLMNEPYTGPKSGGPYTIVEAALEQAYALTGVYGFAWEGLSYETSDISLTENYTVAEVLQLCANARCCALNPMNYGGLSVAPYELNHADEGYTIPLDLAFSYPEYTLSKPIRGVTVTYADGAQYTMGGTIPGEIQTIDNPIIPNETEAAKVAEWVYANLMTRKTISGEFRGDPCLELFDTVYVETKHFGTERVILTSVTHTFTGAFRTTYSGYCPEAVL